MYYIYFIDNNDKLGVYLPGFKTRKESKKYENLLRKNYSIVWIKKEK